MSPQNNRPRNTRRSEAEQIRLIERLSNASGVSGDESEVRKIVLEEIRPYADELRTDALGNVLAVRRGQGASLPRVMLAAHMDEVGFMIVSDDGGGLYRFEVVGGVDPRQLPGKAVLVGADHLPGVIGARPIHHTTREERRKPIPLETLRIDLGPGGEGKAQPGDRAVFATRFTRLEDSFYAKALDDRLGVAILIELFRRPFPNLDLLAAFTVQEEIGARGAKVGAYALAPKAALAVDTTPAYDQPVWDDSENAVYNTRLGLGPAIYIADAGTLADPRWVRHLTGTAEARKLPYQIRQPGGGSTDASAIQRQREGIPVASVSVPGRYLHTAGSIARVADWKNTLALLAAALESFPPDLFTPAAAQNPAGRSEI